MHIDSAPTGRASAASRDREVQVARKEKPGARWWVPDRLTPGLLREGFAACRGCDLYEEATHGVAGKGPEDVPLMVVGEQPGDREDKAGEPFVGPAGRLLDQALREADVDPDVVFRVLRSRTRDEDFAGLVRDLGNARDLLAGSDA